MGNDTSLGVHGKERPYDPKTMVEHQGKEKERDPDAMDVDFTQITPDKKEQLIKLESCF